MVCINRYRAAELLPKCHTLDDAEKYFGGQFVNSQRDAQKAAVAWGLFDGYRGRPETTGGIIKGHESDYLEAVEIGRRISLAERPA